MIGRVSVVGLGKLGACMAATMAGKGMEVIGVDVNARNVDLINQGRAPVVEPGLDEMIAANRARLRATSDFGVAVRDSEVSFIIVPTPSDENGSFSLRYLLQAVREIGRVLAAKPAYHLVVVTSTVLPGSMQYSVLPALEESSGKKCGRDFGLCYNPEFIALGSVIHDLLTPDFLLIGESDDQAGRALEEWYRAYCDNTPPVKRMNWINAELTKISVNTFVTTKITFANMLANICQELPGADIDVVSSALGLDSRIGRRYLTGALGYGGPCFPRDNKALSYIATMMGAPAALAETTDRLNQLLLARQAERISKTLRPGQTVAVLGLAYKPDTNVVEQSQGLALAQNLLGNGNNVVVYDPLAMDNAKLILKDEVTYAPSAKAALAQADAVVIANPCKEFCGLEAADFPRRAAPTQVFDCWRILMGKLQRCGWLDYLPLGIGGPNPEAPARLRDLWR
jgi:UDPglucose 6-dehydrogenase